MFEKIIADYDALYPNQVQYEQKLTWLERLEGQLKDRILSRYDVTPAPEMVGVAPYDEVYIYYLKQKCAERNEDIVRHNNATAAFEEAYNALADYYNRTYTDKTDKTRYTHVLDLL